MTRFTLTVAWSTTASDAANPSPDARSVDSDPAPTAGSDASDLAISAGNDASDPVSTAGRQSATPPPIDPGTPSYEVPVSDELADFARYPVASVERSERNGERRLEYTLPGDLVGADQRLEFKGPDSAGPRWSLQGTYLEPQNAS